MFDATRLLGTLLQNNSTPSAGQRIGNAFGQGGQGGPLGSLLSQYGSGMGGGVLGGLMNALGGRGRDPEADKQKFMYLANQAVSSPREEIARNNPLAVGGLGALAGTLLGGGRGAVGGGLLAVLGSLAYSALQSGGGGTGVAASPGGAAGGYARPGAAPAAAPATAQPLTQADVQRTALLMLRSMIQAAKADGQIDAAEIERITGKIDEEDAAEARAFVLEQMRGPPDVAGLVREVRSPVEAAQVYGAALIAIEVDTPAERDYLARLARELGLEPGTVAQLHTSFGVPAPSP